MVSAHPIWARCVALLFVVAFFALSLIPTVTAPVNGKLAIAKLQAHLPNIQDAQNDTTFDAAIRLNTNFGVFGACDTAAYIHLGNGTGLEHASDAASHTTCLPSEAGYEVTFNLVTWTADEGVEGFGLQRVELVKPSQSRPLVINVVLNIWTGLMMLGTPFVFFSSASWSQTALAIQLFISFVLGWAAFGVNIGFRSNLASNLGDFNSLVNDIHFEPLVGEATWCSLANALLLTFALPALILYVRKQKRALVTGSAGAGMKPAGEQELGDLDTKTPA